MRKTVFAISSLSPYALMYALTGWGGVLNFVILTCIVATPICTSWLYWFPPKGIRDVLYRVYDVYGGLLAAMGIIVTGIIWREK